MTDAAYHAKQWLNRLSDLYEDAKATETAIIFIESRINNAVSNYENTGKGKTDLIVRQAIKEDALIEYAIKREEYEKKYFEFVRQELITMNVLEMMPNRRRALILFAKHINRKSIKQIQKENLFNLERTQLYELYKQALEDLAPLLITEEPRAIRQADATIKAQQIKLHQKQATA